MVKKIICDLDNTITIDSSSESYDEKKPNLEIIRKLNDYRGMGYEICIFTARNMRTYEGDLLKITQNTVPIIEKWLKKHNVPYDELLIGKPWCGEGFYIDDKAIRPSEFLNLSEKEILDKVNETS